jgi:hypothetical protein
MSFNPHRPPNALQCVARADDHILPADLSHRCAQLRVRLAVAWLMLGFTVLASIALVIARLVR